MEEFARILAPYGYDYLVSATSIPGPGNTIVVFSTLGDFMAACVTSACGGARDRKVLWVLSCGGSDEEAYTHEANLVHRSSHALFAPAANSSVNECPSCKRMFVDGETCSRGGCPMGGDI